MDKYGDRRDVPQCFDEWKFANVPSVPGLYVRLTASDLAHAAPTHSQRTRMRGAPGCCGGFCSLKARQAVGRPMRDGTVESHPFGFAQGRL